MMTKTIHVKNIDRFNPGYKDRELIWCKVYFTMINCNPEFELLCEIDKWRFVAFVMLEIQTKKPIPLNEEYLKRKGFDLKKRSISLTLKMLHNSIEVCNNPVTQNRVDKNRIEKNISKQGEPSATEVALRKIYESGFNIYQLINRLKKEIGWDKSRNFPDDVILGVCKQYWHSQSKIANPYAWFIKVIKMESEKWHAEQNVKRGEEAKNEQMPQALKDIMATIFNKGD